MLIIIIDPSAPKYFRRELLFTSGGIHNQPAADPLKMAQIHDLRVKDFCVFQGVYLPVAINIEAKEKLAIPLDD